MGDVNPFMSRTESVYIKEAIELIDQLKESLSNNENVGLLFGLHVANEEIKTGWINLNIRQRQELVSYMQTDIVTSAIKTQCGLGKDD